MCKTTDCSDFIVASENIANKYLTKSRACGKSKKKKSVPSRSNQFCFFAFVGNCMHLLEKKEKGKYLVAHSLSLRDHKFYGQGNIKKKKEF